MHQVLEVMSSLLMVYVPHQYGDISYSACKKFWRLLFKEILSYGTSTARASISEFFNFNRTSFAFSSGYVS